jgi:hypothetical protein
MRSHAPRHAAEWLRRHLYDGRFFVASGVRFATVQSVARSDGVRQLTVSQTVSQRSLTSQSPLSQLNQSVSHARVSPSQRGPRPQRRRSVSRSVAPPSRRSFLPHSLAPGREQVRKEAIRIEPRRSSVRLSALCTYLRTAYAQSIWNRCGNVGSAEGSRQVGAHVGARRHKRGAAQSQSIHRCTRVGSRPVGEAPIHVLYTGVYPFLR